MKILTRQFCSTLVAVCCLAAFGGAQAQLLKYNSEAEIFGAAAISPGAGRQVLRGLIAHCAPAGPSVEFAGRRALLEWEQRHAPYIEESARVKADAARLIDAAHPTAEQRRKIEENNTVQLPKMVAAQLSGITGVIDASPDQASKASLCMSYIESINNGKWELKRNDPVVAKFLDNRIRNRGQFILAPVRPSGSR